MPDFLDEHFIKQKESQPSILTFIGYICLCFIESIGLLLLFFLVFGFIFESLIDPYTLNYASKIIGITIFFSVLLYGVLTPMHRLFRRGNLIVFKNSLLRMNLIGVGIWSFPCLLLGLGTHHVAIGLQFLSFLSIGIFFTSLRFNYPKRAIILYTFTFYWLLSIIIWYWYQS